MNNLAWRKSTYSGGEGNCLEVANESAIFVRDTKDRQGPMLRFTPDAWRRFAKQVKKSLASRADSSPPDSGGLFSFT
jgi:Domain of unknown function (DUF397)